MKSNLSPTANDASRPCPWVKLCGVRDVATAEAIADLAPDAIGLNFFPQSARYVTTATAARICEATASRTAAFGVFVNASVADILRIMRETGIDNVQLHGDEPVEVIAELRASRPEASIVRAWRVGDDGLGSLAKYFKQAERVDALPDAVLVDAKITGAYGGTGHVAPWHLLNEYDPAWPPLILAGGLTPENVAAAIQEVRPWGVDTAGGVESEPGVKDLGRATAFIEAVRRQSRT